ncbi:FAD-binding domain-containing protein [Polyplosphaeria fusca]|uniref:Delta(24)-sterol reductase n=1 Tax=Polyplosphaeria fusca TaxID=682080 RepID=A0A9P4R3U1_9PLEO|nr:FAD-binding domain-containing protein [Polyplosphaeria fusca]
MAPRKSSIISYMDTHRFVVREISNAIRKFHDEKRPFRVYHGPTHSMRSMHDPKAVVHTGDLHHILDINTESKFAMVEPNVPMDRFVKETLKYGLMPAVTPAFPGTTVGGTFAGTAGGSSSFKYGFFDRAVTWIEVVLPDGKIMRASRNRNPDLFEGMVGTLGTIGIATLFQIQLVPATSHVELMYLPVESTIEALDTINRFSHDVEIDFVEGLIFGQTAPVYGVIAIGKLTRTRTRPERRFSRARDPWFYLDAQGAGDPCSVPIMDYLFRYDRGSFCMGRYCFGRIPFRKLTRCIADRAMHSRELMRTVQSLHWGDHFIIQDLVMPMESIYNTLDYLEKNLDIYPLRLCPIRQFPNAAAIMRPNPRNTRLYMGIGIRGLTNETANSPTAFKRAHRELEHVVHDLGGLKWLFSKNFYTEEEFWTIYPQREYEALREKYNAQYLASVYDKIHESERPSRLPKPQGFWNHVFLWTSALALKQKQGRHAGDFSPNLSG